MKLPHFSTINTNNTTKQLVHEILIITISLQLVLEILSNRSLIGGLLTPINNPLMFICNVALLTFTLSFALFTPKRHFTYLLISTLWLSLGITDFIVLSFRTTPLTATDFNMARSVATIINRYLNYFQMALIVIAAITVIGLLIYVATKMPPTKIRLRQSLLFCALSFMILIASYNASIRANAVSRNFSNIADAFLDYGFAYCFTTSIVDKGIHKPDSYSPEKIVEVLESIDPDKATSQATLTKTQPSQKTTPLVDVSKAETDETMDTTDDISQPTQNKANIILIQLESFFDVNRIKAFEYNQNPLPNMTNLKNNFSSGFVTVPSIGAGTANTEFEFLSGMSLDYFGAGEYPYKTILQETTVESLPYALTPLGYYNHAIHNNMGTFYSRNTVYPRLGFDSFTPIEYMNNIDYNPIHWAKDMVLVPEIMKALKSTDEQDFIFTVSVQPHGGYPDTLLIEDPVIIPTVVDDIPAMNNEDQDSRLPKDIDETATAAIISGNTATYNKYLYYVNQIYETDAFVGQLIETLEDFSEPVMVVLYGDHMPSLDITEADLKDGTEFQIDYVIWDNMNLEKVNEDYMAYQMGSMMMTRLGYDEGILNRFHQTMMTSNVYEDELQLLQYDMLYGDRNIYGGVNPHIETTMRMGVDDIVITSIRSKGEAVLVSGKNFTPWSEVILEEDTIDSIFLDDHTLIIPDLILEEGLMIRVAQITETGKELGSTPFYTVGE